MENKLTIEEVKAVVPANLKYSVNQELVDKLNTVSTEPELANTIRENFISWNGVLREGKYKMEDYLNAVKYVSYKMMEYSNVDAYAKTFPQRFATLQAKGMTSKDISAYVAAYSKGKLVTSILEQSLIPFWLLNQDARQKALNTQVELMLYSKSDRVRVMAADSVLAHTEEPKASGPLINVNIGKTSALDDLENTMARLAEMQKNTLTNGKASLQDMLEQKVVEAEVINE